MNIRGFQKLTLLDFPGRTACTVFTGGCNLRCPFCHNVPLVLDPTGEPPVPEEEIFAFLEKRRGILDGVAVTGGEPLLQADLPDFLRRVRAAGFAVKLDTNGFFPEALSALLSEGLADYVAMDLKNTPEKYARTCGLETADLTSVRRSVSLLMASEIGYEFRTTVVRELHTPDDIEEIARRIEGAPRYFRQVFKDSGILSEGSCTPPPRETLFEMLARARRFVPAAELRGL